MKQLSKRLVSSALALSMLTGLGIPVSAAPAETKKPSDSVYKNVLNTYEEQFQNSIYFKDGAADMTGQEWYDQSEVVGINRERAKSQFIPYHSTQAALDAEKSVMDELGAESSQFYQLLSGKNWDFTMVKSPSEASQKDALYLAEHYSGSDFQPRYVPQAWQTYRNADGTFAYEDEPMYTNHPFPWIENYEGVDYNNPSAPTKYNPVGYYRTTFTTPQNWDGREIFLSLQSVESAYYLYINGKPVGYSTDSFTAHDFNITDYLNPAGQENTLALKVFRWSIGSWLENQDFIRQSGIYRDVYLYSKDEVEIRDFFVKTKFDDRTSLTSDVTLTVETDIRGLHNAKEGTYTLSSYLVDDSGAKVASATDQTVKIAASANKSAEAVLKDKGTTVTSTMEVTNPDKWFPDTPSLYSLVLELKAPNGKVLESVVERVGFREIYKVDIDDAGHEQMQITGRQMVLRGVNRHDTDLETGHALNYEDYLTDLLLMKEYNLNAIRTSHYPNDRVLYDLADELGLYVCAEANIESHRAAMNGINVPTGKDGKGLPEWVPPVLDRVATNLEHYKNNPSVVMWSLGNEATYSYAELNEDYSFWVASMYLLKRDPSRLRKYERESDGYQHPYIKDAGADPWELDTRKNNIVDIHSTQYALPSGVANYNGQMPYAHSEYNHAMGQAYGNAKEHWDVIREKDNINGGFIWDYIDQSVLTVRQDEEGNLTQFWGYGGDWTDKTYNDDAFCGNGLVFADRTPSPKLEEAKKVHQQVNFYLDDTQVAPGETITVKVVNEFEHTSLDAFDIKWILTENSTKDLGSGALDLKTPSISGQSIMEGQNVENIQIQLPNFQAQEGQDYLLDFSVQYKEDKPWADIGDELAYEQFQLDVTSAASQADSASSKAFESVTEDIANKTTTLTGTTDYGQKFEIVLDTRYGTIKSYRLDGQDVMHQGPEQSYYRAETYNDTTVPKDSKLKNAGAPENMRQIKVSVKQDDAQGQTTKVTMAMSGSLPVDASALMAYEIYGNGEIIVLDQFIPSSNFAPKGLPKIGSRMVIDGQFDTLTYYGRGPQETYVDRKSGARVGLYEETVYDPQDAMGEASNWVGKKMLKPQENGNHSDVRWTALTNDQGTGLLIGSDGLLEMSALHYTAEELNGGTYNEESYRHPGEVPQREDIVWNIDLHQNGVSDTAFMGHIPLEGYYYPTDKSYTYSYRISPITGLNQDQMMAKGNQRYDVPASTTPITGILINGNQVSGFDINKPDGATYTMEDNEWVTVDSVSVEGNTDVYQVSFDAKGGLNVSAENQLGQKYTYRVQLSRIGKALPTEVFSAAEVENYYGNQTAANVYDNNENTIWHSDWTQKQVIDDLWFMVELKDETIISGVKYLPRSDGNNGTYGKHEIYVSSKPLSEINGNPQDASWKLAGQGEWPEAHGWKSTALNKPVSVKSILMKPISTYGDTHDEFGSCAEFRVAGTMDASGATYTLSEDTYTYTGTPVEPVPEVKLPNGMPLIAGVDYILEYQNNDQPTGTGSVKIVFTGAFTGEPQELTFSIEEGPKTTLTVENGTIQGKDKEETYEVYQNGLITVVADQPGEHEMFDGWVSEQDIEFKDPASETTTFYMTTEPATVTATFAEAYLVTVVNGSLEMDEQVTERMVKPGSSIAVYANPAPEGKTFDRWVTDGADAVITDPARENGLMNSTPKRDITITATYKDEGTDPGPDPGPGGGGGGGSSSKPENPTKPPLFNDVPNDVWYYEAVSYVTKHGLMTGVGDGNFAPHSPLSRAMLTQILYSAAGKPAVSGNAFSDVANGQWYTDSVNWAAQNGIVGGYGDGIFAPNDNITREQLALMLYGFGKLQGMDVSVQGDLNSFRDADEVSPWAGEALLWAHGAGLVSGKENSRLDPKGQATRAEAAQMIQNFMELLEKK